MRRTFSNNKKAVRIMLSGEAFHQLVHGGVVDVKGYSGGKHVEVEIALSDIGYDQMHELLNSFPPNSYAKDA